MKKRWQKGWIVVVCKICGKITIGAVSCIKSDIIIDGRKYAPVAYEKNSESVFEKGHGQVRCPECNVMPGGFHHVGCGLELCPKCGYKWIYCRCSGRKVLPDPLTKGACNIISFKRKIS